MRLEPHENLMVWSIRHDLFGPGRFHPVDTHNPTHYCNAAHIHQAGHGDRWEPGVHHRVVAQAQRPEPADFRSCHCGGEVSPGHIPQDKSVFTAIPLPQIDVVTVPASIAPPMEPGAVQGYLYGQSVPTYGNLLDVVA